MPKKSELHTLGVTDNIVDYSVVGSCLLKDDFGNKIKKLEMEYGYRSIKAIVEEIFRLWRIGNGAKPVSWVGLVACLKLAEFYRIVDEIESKYCLVKKAESHRGSSTDGGCVEESQIGAQIGITISFYFPFLIAIIIVAVGTVFIVGCWCWKHFGSQSKTLKD